MQLLDTTGHLVTRTAYATTSAAGAVGGAAVGGLVGSVRGALDGARSGVSSGSGSTPAAALTLAALGLTGLVEWPVVVAVGGGALAVRLLAPRPGPVRPGATAAAPGAVTALAPTAQPARKTPPVATS
ncbi:MULTISPECIES: hypothetical protein [unclassified Rhodococcus (in: high G+C Gram-positive bacteria)]|uniref:hypothetical protein n=1 Tax=unclassified Rhodococcus (in: high G+C Gram-positive bacteria) TaxID=192944 RepID=UPI0009FA4955|nr:hypothetical protein [Rhodococcus sp. M8]QPG46313.1 hypothetical protein ISO16_04435 [Rhodococcus sp. M8]